MTLTASCLLRHSQLKRLNVASPSPCELPLLYRMAQDEIGPEIAEYAEVERVFAGNAASILALYRDPFGDGAPSREVIGFLALLYLNGAGKRAILAGKFDAAAPRSDWLAAPDQPPAAVYSWAVAGATRLAKVRLARLARLLSAEVFGGICQYGYASTLEGQAFLEKLGYVEASPLAPAVRPGLFVRPAASATLVAAAANPILEQ